MENRERELVIEQLVSRLTLDEKISMIHGTGLFHNGGVERLGIPELVMSDGPMGVRNDFEDAHWMVIGNSDDYVSYLPSNSALAATWNRDLAYESGVVLGEEARGRGKDVILAPGVNIKRSPLCGRNFEYMSEDPYLTGEMAVPLVKGIQSADTAACVKHFALNNQETERLWVEAKVSERALREIYLPAFEKVVKEGHVYLVMGAYNRYHGEHCCESKTLLNGILRGEWKYDGMVVSDWGGVHLTKEAATSGLDLEMSVTDNFDEYCMAKPLKKAVEDGEIAEELIDTKVKNILRLMYKLHMLGDCKVADAETGANAAAEVNAGTGANVETEVNAGTEANAVMCAAVGRQQRKPGSYNTPEHRQKILDAARESIVLLKNDKKLLPLSQEKTRKVLVIGDNANRIQSYGGGSAEIKALYEITPLLGIKMFLGGNGKVDFVSGYYADNFDHMNTETNWQADSLENGGGSMGESGGVASEILEKQKAYREEAVRRVENGGYDTVIFVGGQNHFQDLEGHDRPDMKLPYAQDQLIEELLEAVPEMVMVMFSGSPVEMPWISKVHTLIWNWYNGMEGGTALAEALFGKINPSGRLPETFPVTHLDCPAHCIGEFPGGKTVDYAEGIFVGYRYYDTKQVSVLFPFGYGLSYTEFVYSNLRVEGVYPNFKVSVDVTNIGSIAGKEVVQIYVGKPDSPIERAMKELRGFAKVDIQPGETKTAEIMLDASAFTYYDEQLRHFVTESGEYKIFAGKSVEEICLAESCEVEV